MIQEFKYIFERYWAMVLFFTVFTFLGNAVKPIAPIFASMVLIGLIARQDHNRAVTFMIYIFIMGDSPYDLFYFYKDIRPFLTIIIFIYSLSLILSKIITFNNKFLYIIPFSIISFFSSLSSPVLGLSYSRYISYFLTIFVGLNYILFILKKDAKSFLHDLAAFIAMLNLMGIVVALFFPHYAFHGGEGGVRFMGLQGNPNSLGVFSTINAITLYLYINGLKGKEKLINASIYLGILLISVVWSGSRNAIVSVGIFFMLLFISRLKIFLRIIILSIIIPFFIYVSNPINLANLLTKLGLAQQMRVSTLKDGAGRFVAWQKAVENIALHPLLGRGFYYQEHLFKTLRKVLAPLGHEGDVHNSYLACLLNFGFLGSIAIISYFIYLIFKSEEKSFVLPVIAALGFNAFFEPWLVGSLNPFMISFMILLMLLHVYKTSYLNKNISVS